MTVFNEVKYAIPAEIFKKENPRAIEWK